MKSKQQLIFGNIFHQSEKVQSVLTYFMSQIYFYTHWKKITISMKWVKNDEWVELQTAYLKQVHRTSRLQTFIFYQSLVYIAISIVLEKIWKTNYVNYVVKIYMYIYIYIYILYVYVIYIYFLSHTYCQTGMQLLVCQFLLSQAWFSLLSIRLQDSLIIIFSKKEGIDMLVFCMVLVIKGS